MSQRLISCGCKRFALLVIFQLPECSFSILSTITALLPRLGQGASRFTAQKRQWDHCFPMYECRWSGWLAYPML